MTPRLEAAYAEPHRRYHGVGHIRACLDALDAVQGLSSDDRRLLTWAIWWHDAVYDPRASDNEARSAQMAREDLEALGVSEGDRAETARLIELTAGHEVAPGDARGALLVSIDLAVLGADPAVYDAYAKGVREEYAHVPDDLWRVGRARVLRRFLEAPVLFPEPGFADRLDRRARENLARELAALDAS
jgi:predicted metal-dependent HD superfamily phosphohydrolase